MSDTLRLIMPQWQGGNNPVYSFGTDLLTWLVPRSENDYEVHVPIELPTHENTELPMQDGLVARKVLLNQLRSAQKIIEAYQPSRIITLGGDCLVSQAPFAYLNRIHEGKLGVLWIDAHPDVSTPSMYEHAHAGVLGYLLGQGDKEFAQEVDVPLNPENIMYGGLRTMTQEESAIVEELKLRKVGPEALSENSDEILDWINDRAIKNLAIHLDVDVLDPSQFRSVLFAKPNGVDIDSPSGKMTLAQVSRLINDVSKETDIVGFTIAEYLPWDALYFHDFLKSLPFFD